MRLLLLALVVPSLAFGQGLTPNAPGVTGGGKVLWQAPFSTPGCYASGQTAGASSAISITRTTKGTVALTSDASALTECAAGEFRVGYDGLAVEPARTNLIQQSNTMSTSTSPTSPWVLGAGSSVSTVAGAPMGGTWAQVVGTNANGFINQPVTAGAAYTQGVLSVWMAKASGTGYASAQLNCSTSCSACTCARSDGGACTATILSSIACNAEVSDLGTTPIRLWLMATCNSATTHRPYLIPGQAGVGTTRFSGAQLEVGTYPTSLIVSTSTSVARNSDQISATVPAVSGGKVCLAGTFSPDTGNTWAALQSGAIARFLSLGTSASANLFEINGNLVNTYDAAAGRKYYTYSALAQATSHRLIACSNVGSMALTMDAATVALTPTGAGTGILGTTGTTLYFGTESTANVGAYFGGAIKNVKLGIGKTPKDIK
jgi:hypothetical protein